MATRVPEDPRERRRIRNRLIVLAAAIPIAQCSGGCLGELRATSLAATEISGHPARLVALSVRSGQREATVSGRRREAIRFGQPL